MYGDCLRLSDSVTKRLICARTAPKGMGRSKSNLGYLIDFAINGLISYSIKPIRILTFIGLGDCLVSA